MIAIYEINFNDEYGIECNSCPFQITNIVKGATCMALKSHSTCPEEGRLKGCPLKAVKRNDNSDAMRAQYEEITWGDIMKDFSLHYKNLSSIVDDYRPYAPYQIQIRLRTGVHLAYDYMSKKISNLNLEKQ